MFFGAIIWRLVGTFVRWLLKGFKGSFSDVWSGGNELTTGEKAEYEFATNLIGITTAFIIIILYFIFGVQIYKSI